MDLVDGTISAYLSENPQSSKGDDAFFDVEAYRLRMIAIVLLPWALLLMFSMISCLRLSCDYFAGNKHGAAPKAASCWSCTTLFSIVFGRIINWRQTDELPINDGENALPSVVPKHVAVIMDGNRRYGVAKYGEALRGHWDGGSTLVNFLQWSQDAGIQMVTAYAFSTENWKRPQREINELLTIFEKYCRDIKTQALKRRICVQFLSSDISRFPRHIQDTFRDLEQSTSQCRNFHLNLCVGYGARSEIAHACRRIAQQALSGRVEVDQINEKTVADHLLTGGMPDPDLVVRTSGEIRLSNFLMFQLAYSEMIFVEKNWPALSKSDFDDVLHEFARRQRRYGK